MDNNNKITETNSPSALQLNCCCAYLCNLCPRTSFHSMELLDQHMREEHKQNEDEKIKNIENIGEVNNVEVVKAYN